jgi:hypothetical protein
VNQRAVNSFADRYSIFRRLLEVVGLQAPIEPICARHAVKRGRRKQYRVNKPDNTLSIAVSRDVTFEVCEADEHTRTSDPNHMATRLCVYAERKSPPPQIVFE